MTLTKTGKEHEKDQHLGLDHPIALAVALYFLINDLVNKSNSPFSRSIFCINMISSFWHDQR